MSARPNRRGLLAFIGAAQIAAAAGVPSPVRAGILRRLSPGLVCDFRSMRYADLARVADELDRTGSDLPDSEPLTRLAAALDPSIETARSNPPEASLDAAAGHVQPNAACRAIAAFATAFPAEIAAYRSFGAPMRRRLYAELLARESARLTPPGEPPPTLTASPGPDA